jgi:hypothetical protein
MTAQDPDRLSCSGQHLPQKPYATSPQSSFKPSQAKPGGSGIIDSARRAHTDLKTVQLRRVIDGACMDEQMLTGRCPAWRPHCQHLRSSQTVLETGTKPDTPYLGPKWLAASQLEASQHATGKKQCPPTSYSTTRVCLWRARHQGLLPWLLVCGRLAGFRPFVKSIWNHQATMLIRW